MNCEEFQQIRDKPDKETLAEVRKHAETCKACGNHLLGFLLTCKPRVRDCIDFQIRSQAFFESGQKYGAEEVALLAHLAFCKPCSLYFTKCTESYWQAEMAVHPENYER